MPVTSVWTHAPSKKLKFSEIALSFAVKVKLSTFVCIFLYKIMAGTAHASCVWPLWSIQPSWSKMWAHSWHSFGLPTGTNGMWTKALVLTSRSVWCPRGGHTQQLGALVTARVHPCSHGCNFPSHIERILQLEIISVDLTFANHVAVL